MTVIRVPVEAELCEPEELEDGLGLPVDLGLLPLVVGRLSNEGLEAEPSGDGRPGQGRAVLVSDVHPEQKITQKCLKNGFLDSAVLVSDVQPEPK